MNQDSKPQSDLSQRLHLPERPDAAIACDMTDAPDTPEERLAEYGRLFHHALIERSRANTSITLKLRDKPGVFDWAKDLVQREHACCPFFSFDLQRGNGEVTWTMSSAAGATAQAILDEFYELPEKFHDGLNGFLQRLEKRDIAVGASSAKTFEVKQRASPTGSGKAGCGC